jgi:hypothetical protein
LSQRGRAWVERQDPGSPSGVAIGAWRRYRAVDGPLESALLSLYVLVAINVLVQDRTHELVWSGADRPRAGRPDARLVLRDGALVNLYASDYGGLGVVLAIYFWIAFSAAVIVGAASLAPLLAERRNLRR